MAKFRVQFTPDNRAAEEVTADLIQDHAPFLDFVVWDATLQLPDEKWAIVARYRADDIRKVTQID